MNRAAAFIAAATLFAAPAFAAGYSAKPVTAPATAKIIGKDISWSCAGGTCRGSTEASRPLILCQDLAKRAGRLESFAADGQALSADQLAKCNAPPRTAARLRSRGPTRLQSSSPSRAARARLHQGRSGLKPGRPFFALAKCHRTTATLDRC